MPGMKLRLFVLASSLALVFLPVLRAEGPGFEKKTAAAAKKIIERSDKVIIAGFRVAFNTEGAASASTDSRLKNLGNTTGSSMKTVTSSAAASMKVSLAGLTADDFQRITEQAYADFKAQLAEAGVKVLGPEVLKASKGYGELTFTPSTKDRPYIKDMSIGAGTTVVVFSPAELPLFLGHFDGTGIGGVTMNLGNWRALNQLSVETKAVVLVPTIMVDFVKMKSSGRNKMLKDTAEVGADPQLSLVPIQTGVAVFHAKIRLAGELGNFHLGEELVMPGAFGELKQASASDNSALNSSLVMLTGQAGRVSSKSHHVFMATPAEYEKLSLEAVKLFNHTAGAFIAEK
jgi:hypothetical protein